MTTSTKKPKTPAKLETQVAEAAKDLSLTLPDLIGEDGKAYEAWVMFKLAQRLTQLGAVVGARDHTDACTSVFRIKGGPGNIVSAHATGDQPTHFRVAGPNQRALELHVSIEHVGSSGEVHEVDIGLIHADVARIIRNHTNGAPYRGPRYLCLELKNYGQNAMLDKNISRAFVAVRIELQHDWVELPGGDLISTQTRDRTYCLLTPASLTATTVGMLHRYGIAAFPGAYPGTPQMDEFLDQIAGDVWSLLT